ncbi:MAG: hypothetical protein GY937_04965 [bacterium]|nr:hypothetical protein [bacterium]
MRTLRRLALFILPLALLLSCQADDEEKLETARKAVPEALQRGDRMAARRAAAELGSEVPGNAARAVEMAELLVLAGETPRAMWLLESASEKYPGDADLGIAMALVALRLGNPSLARTASERIPPGSPRHATALILRAQAELGLGLLAITRNRRNLII